MRARRRRALVRAARARAGQRQRGDDPDGRRPSRVHDGGQGGHDTRADRGAGSGPGQGLSGVVGDRAARHVDPASEVRRDQPGRLSRPRVGPLRPDREGRPGVGPEGVLRAEPAGAGLGDAKAPPSAGLRLVADAEHQGLPRLRYRRGQALLGQLHPSRQPARPAAVAARAAGQHPRRDPPGIPRSAQRRAASGLLGDLERAQRSGLAEPPVEPHLEDTPPARPRATRARSPPRTQACSTPPAMPITRTRSTSRPAPSRPSPAR